MSSVMSGQVGTASEQVSPQAHKVGRALEWVIVAATVFVLTGTFHLHFMLTAGDWDFWLDWKDREYWVTLTPVMAIMFCGAAHYILWANFRLPFGATLVCTLLIIAEWIVRYVGWHGWSHYPINLITPAYFTAGALAMDAIMLLSGSWVITGIFGASLFGLLFFPSNWAWLGAFHVPTEANGLVMTMADLIGFENIRTGTPEYIRIIERGTLRTFGQHSTPVSAFFSAFLCTVTYWVWWFAGKAFCSTKYITGRGL
jgi:methane/ammonia monooxygenase subunit A